MHRVREILTTKLLPQLEGVCRKEAGVGGNPAPTFDTAEVGVEIGVVVCKAIAMVRACRPRLDLKIGADFLFTHA